MMLRIDENETQHQKCEDAKLGRLQQGCGSPVTGHKEEGGQQLHRNITRRDFCLAVAAFSAEQNPSEYRNVVIGAYRHAAIRTGRARRDYGASNGNAVNADIQEAAKDESQEK